MSIKKLFVCQILYSIIVCVISIIYFIPFIVLLNFVNCIFTSIMILGTIDYKNNKIKMIIDYSLILTFISLLASQLYIVFYFVTKPMSIVKIIAVIVFVLNAIFTVYTINKYIERNIH